MPVYEKHFVEVCQKCQKFHKCHKFWPQISQILQISRRVPQINQKNSLKVEKFTGQVDFAWFCCFEGQEMKLWLLYGKFTFDPNFDPENVNIAQNRKSTWSANFSIT